MRIKLVVNTLGMVLLLFAPFLLVPLITGLLMDGASVVDELYWYGSVMLLVFVVGGLMYHVTRGTTEDLRDREAFIIVSLVWLIIGGFGALPYLTTGTLKDPMEAYFEAVSGFTTTGATVFQMGADDQGYWNGVPPSLLMWRSLTQWLGGMGIIVLAAVVLSRLTGGGIQLMRAEMPGADEVTKLRPQLKHTAILLWQVYALFTLAEMLILFGLGMPLYDALANSFSTLSTGGFSPQASSIEAYGSSTMEYVIIIFMLLAGINFVLHYHWIFAFLREHTGGSTTPQARFREPLNLAARLRSAALRLFNDHELRGYVLIIVVTTSMITAGLMVDEQLHLGPSKGVRLALFQVASLGTTTGFSNVDYVGHDGESETLTDAEIGWSPALLFLLFLLMFIGGCAGSTAGGMKVIRISVLFRALRRELLRIVHPRAVLPLKIGERTLPEGMFRSVAVFFFIYILLFMVGAFMVAALEPQLDLIEAMSGSIACLSNIGPALGTLGPAGHYGDLSGPTQLVLVMLMWLGRLEIITGLLLFFPSSYKD